MTEYYIKTTIAASLLLFAAHSAVQPACAQTDPERQDAMMVMEGAKTPSSMSAKDKADLTLRRIARAGQRLLVYSTPTITNDPILPWADIPANPSDLMTMRACREEYEPASFVAYPIEDDLTIEVSATQSEAAFVMAANTPGDFRHLSRLFGASGCVQAVHTRCTPDAQAVQACASGVHLWCIPCAPLVHGVGMARVRRGTMEMPGACVWRSYPPGPCEANG